MIRVRKGGLWRAVASFEQKCSGASGLPAAPGSPSAACDKPWCGGAVARLWDIAGFTQRWPRREAYNAVWGQRPGTLERAICGGCFPSFRHSCREFGPVFTGPSVERARLRGRVGSGLLIEAVPRSKPTSAGAQRSTQNWHGPGESDCLIKTKHCDGQRWMLTQCDFCPVL